MSWFDRSSVSGERGMPLIARAWSTQSRLSNFLAMSLMLAIGVTFLSWYYLHMATRPVRGRQAAPSNTAVRAEADAPLPPLGDLQAASAAGEVAEPRLPETQAPVAVTTVAPYLTPALPSSAAGSQPLRPTALERRLSGVTFATSSAAPLVAGVSAPSVPADAAAMQDPLSALLRAEPPRVASARLLPTQRLLLPKGAFIDCTLETAIDSTLPGLTTCITATDTSAPTGPSCCWSEAPSCWERLEVRCSRRHRVCSSCGLKLARPPG